MPRSLIAGLTTGMAVVCASCSMPPQQAEKQEQMTAGLALARVACPHQIAEANAWINHMPGAGRSPRTLHVDVRLAEATDTAVVLKSAASTGDTLVLEVRTSPAAPIPGRLAYREPVPDPLYKRISFFCRGGEIYSISTIERVY